jgi:rhodanese-related sulfurtransferase
VTFWSHIKANDLQKKVDQQTDLLIFDLRDETAYKNGHIPGARCIDFNAITTDFPIVNEETENIPVILYCKTGVKSRLAAEWVVNAGYQNVHSLLQGFTSWQGDIEKAE